MSAEEGSVGASPGAAGEAGEAGECGEASRAHHPRSFKLRFAAQREPGRSYVSLVKPLGLPATVTGKFYARAAHAADAADEARMQAALRRIRAMFSRAPRDQHAAPLTSAHECGWWWREGLQSARATRGDRRLSHQLRDSAWLKARLLVLAADDRLKRN